MKQKTLTILGLSICYIGIVFLPKVMVSFIDAQQVKLKYIQFVWIHFLLFFGMLFYVKKIENKDWSTIGLRRFHAKRDLFWGLIGFVLGGISFGITGLIVELLGLNSTVGGVIKLLQLPLWMRIALAITAGITEELLLRSYPIERLKEWTGNIWIGAAISLVLFSVLHFPFWSLGGSIQIGIATLIWTLIYVKTRSLWTLMISHIANDLFAFVVLPYLFHF